MGLYCAAGQVILPPALPPFYTPLKTLKPPPKVAPPRFFFEVMDVNDEVFYWVKASSRRCVAHE